jgi:hypothetical protein
MTAMLGGSRTSIWGKARKGGCNSELDSRIFYEGQKQSSGRGSVLPLDAAETAPMAGDVTRSSGRIPRFTCSRKNKLMQGYNKASHIQLVPQIKIKHWVFGTEADFELYCSTITVSCNFIPCISLLPLLLTCRMWNVDCCLRIDDIAGHRDRFRCSSRFSCTEITWCHGNKCLRKSITW